MFSRFVALFPIVALAAVAAAAPNLQARGDTCKAGKTSCCNQPFSEKKGFTHGDDGLLEVVVDVIADVGLECDTVGILFLGGGGKCLTQTACCQDTEQSGAVNAECVPVGAQAL